jgi:TatD DNase family protein
MPIDTHCHLADEVFAGDLDAVVERARAAGVSAALCILAADDGAEALQAPRVRTAWPDVRFAAGIHPHRAAAWTGRLDEARLVLEGSIRTHDAVAVGEIGLDYHYDFAPREVQRALFALQIEVAVAADKPVVIHARESIDDTVAVLAQGGPGVRGVMHCFTGTVEEARRSLDLGFYISLSGILTFPRSAALREVAAFVPLDRLLIETDAPFLAPAPHRGRRNEPAWVVETLRALAALRSLSVDQLTARLAMNTSALIPELGPPHAR